MLTNCLKFIPAVLLLFGCERNYPYHKPRATAAVEVNLTDLNGHAKRVACLYSVPIGYTQAQKWPLVVALHGYGGSAAEFIDLWKPVTDSLGFVLLTPQGEDRAAEGIGWAWGSNAERSLLVGIEIVRKATHIDPRRAYVAGFSAGGGLAYAMGLKYPRVFHGIAALGAPFENESISPNTKRQQAIGAFHNLRVYIGHGTLEANFTTAAQPAAEIFRGLGASVTFVPYEGIGHTLPEPMARELAKILVFLDAPK